MEITTVYQKERHEFGRPVNTFAPSEVAILDEFLPESEVRSQHIERNPTILDVQAIPELSETYVNTERFEYVNVGMLHLEGGWPKDVDSTEKDQTQRYKKKVEKDEEYLRQLRVLGDAVEVDIKQNYAIDIYQEYFSGEYADYSSEPPSAKTLSVFRDPSEVKRSVSSVSWHPDGSKLGVAFSIMQFQDTRMESAPEYSYLWDVNNPNTPEMQLKPASPLCCLEYNPKDPHFLVGGSYNGLVSCFDTRTGENPKDQSIIETSHRDPVYKTAWLAGKHPFDCCSTSTDGQVLWWDVRKLSEPLEGMMLIDKASTEGAVMGGVSMEYTTAGGKFLIGTERGNIVSCSRKGKTPADKVGTIFEGHCGPVYGLHRNLFFPKFFVTVGDWRVALWNEELKAPIMTSKFFKSYVLDSMWSPTRPGVFCTVKADGTLDVWDIFYKQNDPTLSLQVDPDGLRSLRMESRGSLLATGSFDGSVYMLQLSEGLTVMQQNEKNQVMQMLERESKREKNLEARAKELRAKEKRAAEAANAENNTEGKESWEENVKAIEEKFWETVGGRDSADAAPIE